MMKKKTVILLILTSIIATSCTNLTKQAIPWTGNAAFPNSEQMKTIGLTQDQLLHLDGVFGFDVEKDRRFDLAAEDINTSASEKLVRHFVFSPMKITLTMYDNINMGITRAARSSATLSALLSRGDVVDGILRFYLSTPIHGFMLGKEAAKVSLSLMAADQILMYPLVFERIEGQEARILRYLCDRYRIMQEANEAREADNPLYGAAFITTYQLATMLESKLRQLTLGGAPSPQPQRTLEEEETLFERCEKLLSKYEDKHNNRVERTR